MKILSGKKTQLWSSRLVQRLMSPSTSCSVSPSVPKYYHNVTKFSPVSPIYSFQISSQFCPNTILTNNLGFWQFHPFTVSNFHANVSQIPSSLTVWVFSTAVIPFTVSKYHLVFNPLCSQMSLVMSTFATSPNRVPLFVSPLILTQQLKTVKSIRTRVIHTFMFVTYASVVLSMSMSTTFVSFRICEVTCWTKPVWVGK